LAPGDIDSEGRAPLDRSAPGRRASCDLLAATFLVPNRALLYLRFAALTSLSILRGHLSGRRAKRVDRFAVRLIRDHSNPRISDIVLKLAPFSTRSEPSMISTRWQAESLSPQLLSADVLPGATNPAFSAVYNANGVYNTLQFVLRLSPRVHRILSSVNPGITTNSALGFEAAQAMSTFLHETVHWWQHIGSTYGFVLSLNYPVQSHSTHSDLVKLVEEDGFKKSVVAQASALRLRGQSGFGTTAGRANTIINNHYDLLTFRAFTLGTESAKAVTEKGLFENVGHAFHMTYAHTVNQLASTVDRDFKLLPHPREWKAGFDALRDKKVEGYYYGSPIGLWPIGSREIFEGQACFAQLQYLSHACGHNLDLDNFRSLGMLHGVYVRAFDEFIRLTDSVAPNSLNDPLVGLFLLVCDLAINPSSGFPFPVTPNFETFIIDVNPGARFVYFCRLIALQFPTLKKAVTEYSRAEYEEISSQLCTAINYVPPLLISQFFANWFRADGALSALREEYQSYVFKSENYPLRYLFAHFLAFQEDKFRRPEYFCWPGAWMAGDRVNAASAELFDKHGALFVDKEDDDAVFPRLQHGRDEAVVSHAFNEFYRSAVVYDLANQWISQPGPFRYDISWLKPSASPDQMKEYLRGNFRAGFQLDPEEVQLIA
jgi:hypothetical protein